MIFPVALGTFAGGFTPAGQRSSCEELILTGMKKTNPTLPGHSPKPVVFLSASAVDFTNPAWDGSSSQRNSHYTFTIYHVFVVAAICAGFALGMAAGAKLFGVAGGVAGAIIGGYAGFVAGQLPELLVLRWLARSLIRANTDELRSWLRDPSCQIPNILLLELERRGEDIHGELGVVLDLLVSEDVSQRGHGWAALTSASPDMARQMGDYRLGDSVDECRRKTGKLR